MLLSQLFQFDPPDQMHFKNMISQFSKFNAHSRMEIAQIIIDDYTQKLFITIANDGRIKRWNAETFTIVQEIYLKTSYLTSIKKSGDHYVVGDGTGLLIFLNNNFQKISQLKVHQDTITSICQNDLQFLCSSSDGKISFINKEKFQVKKYIDLQSPMDQVIEFDGKIYAAGVRAFEIKSKEEVKEIKRMDNFLESKNKLCGFNQCQGFSEITCKFNTYVPCEAAINLLESDKILCFSENCVTVFTHDGKRFNWKSEKIFDFEKGDRIKSAIQIGQQILACGECGFVYTFNLNDSFTGLL